MAATGLPLRLALPDDPHKLTGMAGQSGIAFCASFNRDACPNPCSEARVEVKRAVNEAAKAHELAAGLENQLEMAVRQVAALQARSKVGEQQLKVCGCSCCPSETGGDGGAPGDQAAGALQGEQQTV